MKRFAWVAIPMVMILAFAALLVAGEALAGKGMSAQAVVKPAGELKWEAMANIPRVQAAPLWGVMTKGAHGVFVKLPANDLHPLHTHTHALKIVILSGEFKYQPEGGVEVVLGAGSYLMIPAGQKHVSGTADVECLIFQESTGAFDLKPVMVGTK